MIRARRAATTFLSPTPHGLSPDHGPLPAFSLIVWGTGLALGAGGLTLTVGTAVTRATAGGGGGTGVILARGWGRGRGGITAGVTFQARATSVKR